MIPMIPFLFGVIGLAIGAFAAYAAGGKNRQAAKYYKKVTNELSDKYTNLEKGYHQLTNENTKKIDELNQAREVITEKTKTINELTDKYAKSEQKYHQLATENTQYIDAFTYDSDLVDLLIAFEKESVGFAVKLHQSVISLMCEIHIEATEESIDDLKSLVEEANEFIEEIKENLIIIPDDYYETLLESVTNNNREALSIPVLSIDLGRTSTKACVGREPDNVAFIPANIKQISLASIFDGYIDKYRVCDPLMDLWLEHQGSGYILGQMAADCGANLGLGQSKVEDALVKVLAAAGYFKLKDEISVVISLPFLSIYQFDIEKAQLVSMITGPHLFNFRDESVYLNITKVWVMPNGYGSLLWSEAQPYKILGSPDFTKICVGIVDIGYESIDMLMVDNFRFNRNLSQSKDFGMSYFYMLIAREIEGADSQSLRLIAAVNKPKGERFYRSVNLDDFLPNLTEQFSREICSRILAWLPEQVTDVIITSGGGEFFWEDLQRLLKEQRVNAYLAAPSRQANALGQYIYGELQSKALRDAR